MEEESVVISQLSEPFSKCQIRFKVKAQADEKAQHTWTYVSILRKTPTLAPGLK
jgi:hypothetical protein